jgi:hypothetical protein
VDLPSDQRHLLQVIFDRFHETGEWPLEADLRYELDQADDGLDIPDVARRLVPGYAYVQSGEIPATLTIHGVAASTGSEGELQDLLAVTQYAYRRYRDGHGKGRFTDADLATDMGMDELQVRRVQKLLGGLPWDGGGGGDAGGGSWYRIVGSDIVLFKRVQTVAELMAAIPLPQRLDPIATREARAAHAAGLLDAPVRPAPESSRRYPYDVALSFAGEQRPYLEQVAAGLKSHGLVHALGRRLSKPGALRCALWFGRVRLKSVDQARTAERPSAGPEREGRVHPAGALRRHEDTGWSHPLSATSTSARFPLRSCLR